MKGYATGGKHPPGGDYGFGGTGVNVTQSGAGMGTGAGQPNTKDDAKPGGHGSTGKKSDSSPSK